MKFGDVVTAVASLAVVCILLGFVFSAVMIPVNSTWGVDVATILSILVSSLIIGYVFAAKIQEESRRGAISRIFVLFSLLLTFYTMALFTNPYISVSMQEVLEDMFPTSGWTTMDWVSYSQLVMVMIVALNVVFALVFGFIGLYAGSMLRKPRKNSCLWLYCARFEKREITAISFLFSVSTFSYLLLSYPLGSFEL